jgi:acyl-CoA thioesterase FadM
MPRLKITLPERFIFSTEVRIRIGDINFRNHLGHEGLIGVMHEARAHFLEGLGYFETGSSLPGLILTDIQVAFLRQVIYGQTLRVELAFTGFTDKGFDVIHRVTDVETGDEIARAKIGLLCYDYRQQRTVPAPQHFREKLSG